VSADPTRPPPAPGDDAGGAAGQPTEEELRAAYEAELSRITSADMMLQAAVSLLNIGGRKLGAAGRAPAGESGAAASQAGAGIDVERDLEQVRDAIDAVRALLEILERRLPTELGPLRDALSQLQIAYAREVQVSAADSASGAGEPPTEPQDTHRGDEVGAGSGQGAPSGQDRPADGEKRPGPAEASGRLWVPGR
jgi:hypothetical protein